MTAVPDFANTITALERSGRLLAKVSAVLYDLVSAHSNPAILETTRRCRCGGAARTHHDERGAVRGRIALLHDNRASLDADPPSRWPVGGTHTRFPAPAPA